MNTYLTFDLATKKATSNGSSWSPPACVFGDDLALVIGFQRTVNGAVVPQSYTVTAIQAGVGNIDMPPVGGTWCLQVGAGASTAANTTGPLAADAGPLTVQNAINAIPELAAAYGTVQVASASGSYLLKWTLGGVVGSQEIPLKIVNNLLWPAAFGRVYAFELGAEWVHEVRLVQAPVAFTSNLGASLPASPTIKRIVSGGNASGTQWDEIQQLTIPPDFDGTFRLVLDNVPSDVMDRTDNTASIAAAMTRIGAVTVTDQAKAGVAWIDFSDAKWVGSPQDLFVVQVVSAPAASLKIVLNLGTGQLFAMLREKDPVTLPLHVKITLQDPDDPTQLLVCQIVNSITIGTDLLFAELEAVPVVDWLRRPDEKSYIPFGVNNTITGQQFYGATVGDGHSTVFVIAHPLATETLDVIVRENLSGGRILVNGKAGDVNADYSVTVDSANQVTVTALNAVTPSASGWVVTIVSAGTVAAFAAWLTVTIAQVTGLQTQLDAMNAELASLNALLPSSAISSAAKNGTAQVTITIPTTAEILFSGGITDVTNLPSRAPYLLPAVEKAATDGNLPSPLPAVAADTVWASPSAVVIPGGGMVRTSTSVAGGFVASDGRILYPATRSGTSSGYYPTPFERVLWEAFIDSMMFASGTTLNMGMGLTTQLVGANVHAQWVVVLEWATISRETVGSPDTSDVNLLATTWQAPMVKQQLVLSGSKTQHDFGLTLTNTGGVISGNATIYGRVLALLTTPSGANFALRARLIEFDTDDSVSVAAVGRGWVSYALVQPANGNLGITIG